MGRPALSLKDYISLAQACNLEFIGPMPVDSSDATPAWRCLITGLVQHKSYNAVKATYPYGNRYQRDFKQQLDKYTTLAKHLGIEFIHEKGKFPYNVKVVCSWRGRNGNIVRCSYHDLAYQTIPRRLLEELGIEN